MDGDQLVWAAAGSPVRGSLVPGPRTEAWAAVRAKLSSDVPFENGLGCLKANVAKIEVGGVFTHATYLRVYVTTTAQAGVYLPCPAVPVAQGD